MALYTIGSHDHSLISPRWSQEPRVSLSSARAGWIRIPFSLTSLQRLTCVTFLSWQHSAGVTLCDAWLAVITPLGSYIRHKVTKKVLSIKRKFRVESESGPALKYVFMFAQWDELFISEYWLCHPPICAASPDIWTPNIGRWVISENNKDVTGVMLDDDNNTNILITDSWLWWQW